MSESKQRWRLVFARDEEARYLSHLDASHLWERAMKRGRIPVAMSEGFNPRPRLVFAAPLPLGMLAEHELADLFVSRRLTRREMRGCLEAGMPRGFRLIDLRDEWVGAPALATELVAADYRLTLLGVGEDRLRPAVEALLGSESLPRERRREKKVTAYDLRPLLLALRTRQAEAGIDQERPAAGIWMRLRHSQRQGSGRPEEVVAALADRLGLTVAAFDQQEIEKPEGEEDVELRPSGGTIELSIEPDAAGLLEMVRPVRERLWLEGEAPVDATGHEP
jgi:radical SAM-linked protein